jgi:hypothetical protein
MIVIEALGGAAVFALSVKFPDWAGRANGAKRKAPATEAMRERKVLFSAVAGGCFFSFKIDLL